MDSLNKPKEGLMIVKADRKTKKPNQDQFTLSLMKAGIRTRRITAEKVELFQLQIMDILKELILRYTKGESTSVTVDAAENILSSILYSIDTGLQSLNDTEAALEIIKGGSAREVYEKGLALVTAAFAESEALYLELRKGRLKVGLEAYDLTIDEGLELFFNKYGAVFNAHHTMVSIDYPLLFDEMSNKGVFYIKEYIETLYMEDQFCRLFPEEEIKKILTAYGRIYKIDYTKTLTNIFELVVNAALFSILSEINSDTLLMTKEKYAALTGKFKGKSPLGLDALIDEGINNLKINEKKLSDYILKCGNILKTRVKAALETDSLKKLVLLEDELSLPGQNTFFTDGERLDNEYFTKVAWRLTKERDVRIKARIIELKVHSLEDLIELLEGDCFFGDEYSYLYSKFNDQELALLAGNIFSDDMRDGYVDIKKAISFGINSTAEWQEKLVEFLSNIKKDRLKAIETLMNNIANF